VKPAVQRAKRPRSADDAPPSKVARRPIIQLPSTLPIAAIPISEGEGDGDDDGAGALSHDTQTFKVVRTSAHHHHHHHHHRQPCNRVSSSHQPVALRTLCPSPRHSRIRCTEVACRRASSTQCRHNCHGGVNLPSGCRSPQSCDQPGPSCSSILTSRKSDGRATPQEFDGASRGNPGVGGCGALVRSSVTGKVVRPPDHCPPTVCH
jgi:hypothetical protein